MLFRSALKGIMNIGNISISQTGHVFFNTKLVGTVARFDFHARLSAQCGHLSLSPCESDEDMQIMAKELATSGISLSLDFYGEFWPNSYVKDGMWHMEIAPGKIVPLDIRANLTEASEENSDDSASSVY